VSLEDEVAKLIAAITLHWSADGEPIGEPTAFTVPLPGERGEAVVTLLPPRGCPPAESPASPPRPTGGGGACAAKILDALDRAGQNGLHFTDVQAEVGERFSDRAVTANLKRLVEIGLIAQPRRRGPYVHVKHLGA
jgi:hypothetical protein